MNSYVARLTQKVTPAMITCSNNNTLTKQDHKRYTQFKSTTQFKYLKYKNKKNETSYLLFTGVASFSKRTLLHAVWIITVMYRLWWEKRMLYKLL
jgi:hypothetical protein